MDAPPPPSFQSPSIWHRLRSRVKKRWAWGAPDLSAGFRRLSGGQEASRTGRGRPPAPSPDPEAWEDRRPPPSLPRPDRPAGPGEEGTPSPCRADRGRRAPGESCSSSVSAPPPHPTSSPGPAPRASPGRSPLHHRTWNHPPCQTSWPEGGRGGGEIRDSLLPQSSAAQERHSWFSPPSGLF